jgi:hypothetical protein
LLASVNAELPSPQLVSISIKVIIFILAVSMAFEELGLAERTVLLAFGIVFGALMLGLAIAFGMGGRELARQFLERRFSDRRTDREKASNLSPL